MAAVIVALLQLLGRAAKAGTLPEIAETALKLIGLVLPLIEEGEVKSGLLEIQETVQLRVRPAAPEDPAMRHAAGRVGMGGR